MARVAATTAVDLTHVDFGAIFASRTAFQFQDNANVVSAAGFTYEDMLKLTLPGGSFSIGGTGLLVDGTGLLLSGTVTGLFRTIGSGSAGYSIEGLFISGTSLRVAAQSVAMDDDDQLLALALAGADTFNLSSGNDRANGFSGKDTMRGGAGSDALFGGEGDDSLNGGDGSDRLDGGAGVDTMSGGVGNDVYIVNLATDQVRESSNGGTDTVRSSYNYTLPGNVENLVLLGALAFNGTGNTLANTLTGSVANNRLLGLQGRDSLLGGGGNDTLDGGTGIDTMVGGAGNDVYYLDVATDQVVELAGGGTDTLITEVSWTLGTTVENLQLGTTLSPGWQANLTGTGNSLANQITGGGGANRLAGGAGNDTLNGVTGRDTLIGGAGDDTFVFQAVYNADTNLLTVSDFVSADDSLSFNHNAYKKLDVLGPLPAANFRLGAAAADGDDHLIYNTATGALYYDADGSGFLGQLQIAQFTSGTMITAADLFVY